MSRFKTQAQKSLSLHSIFIREPVSSSSQSTLTNTKTKKPLSFLFEESVGLSPKTHSDDETESNDIELRNKLKELETEVRDLKAKTQKREIVNIKENAKEKEIIKRKSLLALFLSEKETRAREKEPEFFKELSPDMEMFVTHLHSEGYFSKANFLRGDKQKLDFSYFNNSYGRDFIKFAAERFGKDHQEIAKWLSGGDLKKVASFGCPSLARRDIFSAKQLRVFFEIPEAPVCRKCVLRDSCNFVDQRVLKGQKKTLNLAAVIRVVTLYGLEAVPPQLPLPDDLKASVSKLLKEAIDLSKTTDKDKSSQSDSPTIEGRTME